MNAKLAGTIAAVFLVSSVMPSLAHNSIYKRHSSNYTRYYVSSHHFSFPHHSFPPRFKPRHHPSPVGFHHACKRFDDSLDHFVPVGWKHGSWDWDDHGGHHHPSVPWWCFKHPHSP